MQILILIVLAVLIEALDGYGCSIDRSSVLITMLVVLIFCELSMMRYVNILTGQKKVYWLIAGALVFAISLRATMTEHRLIAALLATQMGILAMHTYILIEMYLHVENGREKR